MDLSSLVGTKFDNKYEILAVAGGGGMGTVFKAKQIGLERIVALKVLNPDLFSDDESRSRFELEARSISIINHPNIATFYSYGEQDNNLPYIVMEYLEGTSLREVLQETPRLGWQRALKIAAQICKAMDYAHRQGVIHRDLKPNNIVLLSSPEPDFVKIVDFGLAKLITNNSGQRLTKTGELIGSVQYLSPEQCLGRPADARSDIYSLGCIIYEMAVGEVPFEAENPIGLIHKHANEVAIAPSKKCHEEFPESFDRLVLKAMSKQANNRYQSMESFGNDIAAILEGTGAKLHFARSSGKFTAPKKLMPLFLASAGALLLTGLTAYWVLMTDTGISTLAQISITCAPKQVENLKGWLDKADKLETARHTHAADQIIKLVSAALKEQSGFLAPSQFYLNMSAACLKSGDKEAATRWALRAIFSIPLDKLSTHREKALESLEIFNSAGSLLLDSGQKLSRSQSIALVNTTRRWSISTGFDSRSMLELIHERALNEPKLTEDMSELLLRYLSLVSKEGNYAAIKSSYKQAIEGIKHNEGEQSPRIPLTYFEIAIELAKSNDIEHAKEFIDAGRKVLISIADHDYPTYGVCWTYMSKAYVQVGMQDEAMTAAKNSLRVSCSAGNNCGHCTEAYLNLSAVFLNQNDRTQAEKFAFKALESIHLQNLGGNEEAIIIEICRNLFLINPEKAAEKTKTELAYFKSQKEQPAYLLSQLCIVLAEYYGSKREDSLVESYLKDGLNYLNKSRTQEFYTQQALNYLLDLYLTSHQFGKAKKLFQDNEAAIMGITYDPRILGKLLLQSKAEDKSFYNTLHEKCVALVKNEFYKQGQSLVQAAALCDEFSKLGESELAASVLENAYKLHSTSPDRFRILIFLCATKLRDQDNAYIIKLLEPVWQELRSEAQILTIDKMQLGVMYARSLMENCQNEKAKQILETLLEESAETSSMTTREHLQDIKIERIGIRCNLADANFRMNLDKNGAIETLYSALDELKKIDSPSARSKRMTAYIILIDLSQKMKRNREFEQALDGYANLLASHPDEAPQSCVVLLAKYGQNTTKLGMQDITKKIAKAVAQVQEQQHFKNEDIEKCLKLLN